MNENIGPLALNLPLIGVQIVGFLILIWLLSQYVFKPIFAILDERQREIKEIYDQVEADRKQMEETRRQYEQRLAQIDQDARDRIQAGIKEAQQLRDNMLADARVQADALIIDGRNEVERERQKAFLDLRQQIVALTVAAAGKLVGESLDDSRHVKLVDDFIADVGSGAAAQGTVKS